jgi:adenylate kinase
MPRPPSSRLRLANILRLGLERVERNLTEKPGATISKTDAEVLLLLTKADALIQGRRDDEKDDDAPPTDPEELRKHLRKTMYPALRASPAASSAEDESDEEKP